MRVKTQFTLIWQVEVNQQGHQSTAAHDQIYQKISETLDYQCGDQHVGQEQLGQ